MGGKRTPPYISNITYLATLGGELFRRSLERAAERDRATPVLGGQQSAAERRGRWQTGTHFLSGLDAGTHTYGENFQATRVAQF